MQAEIIEHEHFDEYQVEQGSEEWFLLRKGKPTASNFHKIITAVRGDLSKSAEDYACELIGDEFSEIPPEGIENATSRAIRWGQHAEEQARAWYELQTGLAVRRTGLLVSKDGRFGASPDGLVGETGGLELKCPQAKQHVIYCNAPHKLLNDYRQQVHGSLFVSKRLWWDLVSYSPGLPGLRIRVEPDDYTKMLATALEGFWTMYRATRERVMGTPEILLDTPKAQA